MRARPLIVDLALLAAALAAALGLSVAVVRAVGGRPAAAEAGRPAAATGEPRPIMRAAERRLRDMALRTLEPQLERSPEVAEAMEAIRSRVVAGLDRPPEDLRVLVLDSATVNAFTFPGGLVVVCAGLVRTLESADELAAVVAHEVAHVVHRDAARSIGWQLGLSAALTVLGGREAEVLLQRLLGELISMHYSREVEQRADETALRTLEAAGIDPGALADAFGRLEEEGEARDRPAVMQYLASHPDLGDRIERARAASREAGARRSAGRQAGRGRIVAAGGPAGLGPPARGAVSLKRPR